MKPAITKYIKKCKIDKRKKYHKLNKSKNLVNQLFIKFKPNKQALITYFKKCYEETKSNTDSLLVELNILESGSQYITISNDNCDLMDNNEIKFENLSPRTDYLNDKLLEIQFSKFTENDRNDNNESFNQLLAEEEKINSRILTMKQQNLWFQETIDKAQIIPRPKFHWDFILAEMNWLAEDFNREKTWKRICAKKLANSVVKALREKKNKISKDAKQETFKMRKSCASIAKMIKDFWKQMEKIVLAKQQFRLNAKHQEAMTTHLGKVIETTEKYTEWLTEDLKSNAFHEQLNIVKDPDFIAKSDELDESDFEETIEIDEKELAGVDDTNQELEELLNEGKMDLSDLIAGLPEGYLLNILSVNGDTEISNNNEIKALTYLNTENIQLDDIGLDCIGSEIVIDQEDDSEIIKSIMSNNSPSPQDEKAKLKENENYLGNEMEEGKSSEDEEFDENESSENDDTLVEQEQFEKQAINEYTEEIDDLMNEANLPLNELLKRYEIKSEKILEDSICESDSSSTSSELSSSRESSSESVQSTSSMNSRSSEGLNNLLFPEEPNKSDNNKFQFPGEIEALTEAALSTQPKGFTIESADIKVNVPHLIRHTLREYQCVGLDWLAAIYEKRLNGILADEMGLGKTIQTIALLSYLACEKAIWGPHLIIVPTSVILNWEIEFKKWCPGFKILTYYGSLKERREKRKGWTKTNAFHVCITSYKLAIQDSLSFKRKKWKYLILDEAQNIKNFKSQRWQTLLTFNSQRRLLLTGTPLQNNLMELWSLMHFLMPNIFQSHKEFQEWFGSPLTGMIEGNAEYNEQLVRRLHKLLRPFILRRLKKDVEKQMPKKYEHIIMCKLSKRQRFLYDDFMSLASTQETLAGGQFLSVINILMQLRKVCNHPNLFETRPTISPCLVIDEFHYSAPKQIFIRDSFANRYSKLPFGTSGLADLALNLPKFVSERILNLTPKANLIEEIDSINVTDWVGKNKSLLGCSSMKNSRPFLTRNMIFANIPDETYRLLNNEEFDLSYLSKLSEREFLGLQISEEQKPRIISESMLPEHIINARVQNRQDSLKLMAQRNINRSNLSITLGPDVVDFLTLKKPSRSSKDYNFFQLPLVTGSSLNEIYKDSENMWKRFVFCVPPALSNGVRVNKPCLMRENEIKFTNQFLSQIKPLIPVELFHIVNLQRVQFPDTRLIQYDCGKLQTLEILLKRLHKESHRCLIFTQMTRMLDILEQFLSYLGYRYLRLDGTTKVEQRQLLMESFNQDSRIFVFILSTRSGGLGVNLTGADTVIFYDSDWNPTMDAQAQDRCHRIGQTRDVHIYRLISQMTVEENILKKANQKRTLNDMAIEGGQFNTAFFKSNTLQDLFKAPSGLEDLLQEQGSSENESCNIKLESLENKKNMNKNKIITRSGRQIKWRGPPIVSQFPEKTVSKNSNDLIPCSENCIDTTEFEEALLQIEDENDRIAASNAKAEMKADLAEFDETIPWEEIENSNDQHMSNPKSDEFEKEEKFHLETERQIKEFEEQLNPIQRFGVRVVESVIEDTLVDQLESAKQNLESSKKAWHLEQLKALHEADEMKAEIEEDDMLYCYGNYDPTSQKKELERLKREEAEFFKAEKRKTEEKAKQAKADAARRAWSRQQHLLAIKRKHLQINNRFNKISRPIKQNRVMGNMEYSQKSLDMKSVAESASSRIHNEASSCKTLKSNHFPSHKANINRPFYPKVRFNNSSQSYYYNPRSQTNNIFPTFHLAPRPNLSTIQNHQNNVITIGKPAIQMQSISLSQNQEQFIQQSVSQNFPTTSQCSTKSSNSFPSRVMHNSTPYNTNNTVNINYSSNQCINSNINNSVQIKTSNISNGYSSNSQSSFQIPIQSLCNFRTSLPGGQPLIINSQPVLFINRPITAQNHSIITRPQGSVGLSAPMMQIINRPSNINLQTPQTRFSNPSSIPERARFNNMISIPNSQSFILPSVSGSSPNIIRINCNTSNNFLSKPDFMTSNIVSLNNLSNSVLRLAAVSNSITSINGNYQTIASNPMIIINNNNINQNKSIFSTSLPNASSNNNNNNNNNNNSNNNNNIINRPITVSQIINSNVMPSTRTNNLQH